MNYIVAYTLKNNKTPDTFVDRWMPFLDAEYRTLDDARSYYNEIVANDGNEDGWHLYTITLSKIIQSTDY